MSSGILKWIGCGTLAIVCGTIFLPTSSAEDAKPADAKAATAAETRPSLPEVVADPAFDRYVNLAALADAYQGGNSGIVLDIALQLAEGERILLRSHKAISADELLKSTLQLAKETRDKETIGRLAQVAKSLNKTELAALASAAEKLSSASRSANADLTVSIDNTSLEAFGLIKATLAAITSAKAAQDKEALQEIKTQIDQNDLYADAHKKMLHKQIDAALSAITANPNSAISKLTANSRQIFIVPPGPFQPAQIQFQSPQQISGFNPWTGGWNTQNSNISTTVFTPGRDQSRFNGSARPVNRPVYDSWGNLRGWERGTEWTNSMTGQTHKDTQIYTPNGIGGTNTTNVMRSVAPGSSSSSGSPRN